MPDVASDLATLVCELPEDSGCGQYALGGAATPFLPGLCSIRKLPTLPINFVAPILKCYRVLRFVWIEGSTVGALIQQGRKLLSDSVGDAVACPLLINGSEHTLSI